MAPAGTTPAKGRAGKKTAVMDLTTEEAQPAPPVPAPVVSSKRTATGRKATAALDSEVPAAVPPPAQKQQQSPTTASQSPVSKRSRRAEAVAEPTVEPAPLAASSSAALKRARSPPPTSSTQAKGPFSAPLPGQTGGLASPAASTRSRAGQTAQSPVLAQSNAAASSVKAAVDALSGPFSASYVSRSSASASSPRRGSSSATKGSTARSVCVLRVIKGGDKGLQLEVSCETTGSTAGKRSRKAVTRETLYRVGRGEDCDLCLQSDDYLSERCVALCSVPLQRACNGWCTFLYTLDTSPSLWPRTSSASETRAAPTAPGSTTSSCLKTSTHTFLLLYYPFAYLQTLCCFVRQDGDVGQWGQDRCWQNSDSGGVPHIVVEA
jgi:hypothetical protein